MRTNIMLCFLLPFLSACGIHVTSDPVVVDHRFHFDMETITEYCDKKYPNDDQSFKLCVQEFSDLFNLPLVQ